MPNSHQITPSCLLISSTQLNHFKAFQSSKNHCISRCNRQKLHRHCSVITDTNINIWNVQCITTVITLFWLVKVVFVPRVRRHLFYLLDYVTLTENFQIDDRKKEAMVITTYHNFPNLRNISGADPGCGWGGTQLWSAQFCQHSAVESREQSELIRACGLGPALGPQKLLGFSWLNMHSPSFPDTFWLNFFWFISIQNVT